MRLIALDDFWEGLRIKLRLKRKSQAKEFLIGYVGRRHKIVHEADAYKTKKFHGKLRGIKRPFAVDCVTDVARFVNALDKIVAEHLARIVGADPS